MNDTMNETDLMPNGFLSNTASRHRHTCDARRRNRDAFTLLELLLSIGLIAILAVTLSLVSHSFVSFRKHADAAFERTVLLRAFLDDITRDIRGIPELSDASGLTNRVGAENLNGLGTETFLRWETEGEESLIPFYGTPNALFFRTNSYNAHLDTDPPVIKRDMCCNGILWLSPTADRLRFPILMRDGNSYNQSFSIENKEKQIYRFRVTPTKNWMTGTHEEIASLQFRYWDGFRWLANWNSLERGDLPRAIEVVVRMQNSSDDMARTVISIESTSDTPNVTVGR